MHNQIIYSTIKQTNREIKCKIELLDFQLQTVDELTGDVIDGSISVDASSSIRRTCDITMAIRDRRYDVVQDGRIWIDKYIVIYLGIVDMRTQEIAWNKQGVFLINNPNRSYDNKTNTIKIQGLDLASKLTGLRNGTLESMPTVIPQDSSIRNSMISTLALGGFTRYVIEDVAQKTPYEIKVEPGGTIWDILEELNNIVPSYEIFFDVDGVFHYQKIPSTIEQPVILDNDILDSVILGLSSDTDFESVKNKVEVFGKSLTPDYYGGTATVSSGAYNITIDSFTKRAGNLIGFTTTSKLLNPKLKINSLAAFDIVNEDGSAAVIPYDNEYYVVRVLENGKFLFMGRQQPRSTSSDTNPRSPFYIGGTVGSIYTLLQGGEFDLIWTDDLCRQRADYELWKATNMNNNISIDCVPIYWLDVNQKISYLNIGAGIYEVAKPYSSTIQYEIGEYVLYQGGIYVSRGIPPIGTLPSDAVWWLYMGADKNGGYAPQQFIVKTISHGITHKETQSIGCIKFYPFYPHIIKN